MSRLKKNCKASRYCFGKPERDDIVVYFFAACKIWHIVDVPNKSKQEGK